ncbi:MAG: hypothetical protein ABGW87_12365 [Sphingomonadaceae bacterium]
MTFVLEWRPPNTASQPIRSVVSYMRVFRSAAAVKAFVCSRGFAEGNADELRLSAHRQHSTESVFTTVADILRWNPRQSTLPSALADSKWEAELGALGLPDQILDAVTKQLKRAQERHFLSDAQVQRLRAMIAAALAGKAL